MVAETTIIAIVVGVLAVLYGIALTGDHPVLSNHLWGVGADRSPNRAVSILVIGVGIGVALYAVFVFEGEFGAPTGTTRWWVGVAVAILAIVLVGGSLLWSVMTD